MLNEILKKEESNTEFIYLYKQGCFFRAYNQSAMHFLLHITDYKVHVKFIKKLNRKIYYLGFPTSNWINIAQICAGKIFHIYEAKECIEICLNDGQAQNFTEWAKNQDVKLKTNRNDNLELEQAIQGFSVANSTSLEALNFISELQNRIQSKTEHKSHE